MKSEKVEAVEKTSCYKSSKGGYLDDCRNGAELLKI